MHIESKSILQALCIAQALSMHVDDYVLDSCSDRQYRKWLISFGWVYTAHSHTHSHLLIVVTENRHKLFDSISITAQSKRAKDMCRVLGAIKLKEILKNWIKFGELQFYRMFYHRNCSWWWCIFENSRWNHHTENFYFQFKFTLIIIHRLQCNKRFRFYTHGYPFERCLLTVACTNSLANWNELCIQRYLLNCLANV